MNSSSFEQGLGNESIEGKEAQLERINAEVAAVIRLKKEEIRSGESIQELKEVVVSEKRSWLENPDLARRIRKWDPNVDSEEILENMKNRLSTADILLLDPEDTAKLNQLHLEYNCLVEGVPVPDDFVSPFSCAFVQPDKTVPPALRDKIQMIDPGVGAKDFITRTHHEIGHLTSFGLFTEKLKINSELPVAHSTTDPGTTDPEGFVEYLSLAEEIDVRTRSMIVFLSDVWNPIERLATMNEVRKIRDAVRWDLPLEVRELRNHFDDDQLLWMLNHMPAV